MDSLSETGMFGLGWTEVGVIAIALFQEISFLLQKSLTTIVKV
ncbi:MULTISPECIES: hypothetical protein [Cyanophyceae]|jgi:hypothetical protein|nr:MULTISPECIES: hypothetical protein [unclassified Trichocoleus]